VPTIMRLDISSKLEGAKHYANRHKL